LSVGNRQEPGGRISLVRLKLDPPSDGQREALLRAVEISEKAGAKAGAESPHDHDH
jgi:hypothetical protein